MHSAASVQFHASNMVLNIHSDASYLSEANAHSRACKHWSIPKTLFVFVIHLNLAKPITNTLKSC